MKESSNVSQASCRHKCNQQSNLEALKNDLFLSSDDDIYDDNTDVDADYIPSSDENSFDDS